jgi:hypothetical protein
MKQMLQFIIKLFITLAVVFICYFILHKTWTHDIDIAKWIKKFSDVIPVKEQGDDQSKSTEIQQKILQHEIKQTRLLEQMKLLDVKNHEKLIQTYPLGYVLFAIKNDEEIITYSTNRLQKGWRVDWNDAKVVTINENQISIIHPGFYSKDGKRAIVGNIIGASRKKRNINLVSKGFGLELFCGILADDSDGIICLLGIKEQS